MSTRPLTEDEEKRARKLLELMAGSSDQVGIMAAALAGAEFTGRIDAGVMRDRMLADMTKILDAVKALEPHDQIVHAFAQVARNAGSFNGEVFTQMLQTLVKSRGELIAMVMQKNVAQVEPMIVINRMPVDEDALEAAFWSYDAQRKSTGADRDAFKMAVRGLMRDHATSAIGADKVRS